MIDALHIVSTRAILRALHRRPAEMGLLSALTEHPGRPTSVKELGDIIYGNDSDGGPLHFEDCIRVMVCRLRHRGVEITTHKSRGYSMGHS